MDIKSCLSAALVGITPFWIASVVGSTSTLHDGLRNGASDTEWETQSGDEAPSEQELRTESPNERERNNMPEVSFSPEPERKGHEHVLSERELKNGDEGDLTEHEYAHVEGHATEFELKHRELGFSDEAEHVFEGHGNELETKTHSENATNKTEAERKTTEQNPNEGEKYRGGENLAANETERKREGHTNEHERKNFPQGGETTSNAEYINEIGGFH